MNKKPGKLWKILTSITAVITAIALVAIPVNYALSAHYGWSVDYMLYYSGNGAPLLPELSNRLASVGLRPVYTCIVFVLYVAITAVIVAIIRSICFFKSLCSKTKN